MLVKGFPQEQNFHFKIFYLALDKNCQWHFFAISVNHGYMINLQNLSVKMTILCQVSNKLDVYFHPVKLRRKTEKVNNFISILLPKQMVIYQISFLSLLYSVYFYDLYTMTSDGRIAITLLHDSA